MALLARWGWGFIFEEETLWRKVVESIHGSGSHNWHTLGNYGRSLRSPWINISWAWLQVEYLASFILNNGRRILFWRDTWLRTYSLSSLFPSLLRIGPNPKDSVLDHGDPVTQSWITFRRFLKEDEVLEFQRFLASLEGQKGGWLKLF